MIYKTVTLKEIKEGERGKIIGCSSNELSAIGFKQGMEILALRKRKLGGIFVVGGRRFAVSASLFKMLQIEKEDGEK